MTSLKVKFPVSLDCSGRGSEEETDQSENTRALYLSFLLPFWFQFESQQLGICLSQQTSLQNTPQSSGLVRERHRPLRREGDLFTVLEGRKHPRTFVLMLQATEFLWSLYQDQQ